MRIRFFAMIFLLPACVFGQLTNTVTVAASRASTAQPDQTVFNVSVTAPSDKTLDDVVGALSGSGITAANLVSVTAAPLNLTPQVGIPLPTAPYLQWTFQITAPIAKLKDTSAALAALQKSVAQKNSGMTLSFSVQGAQASAQTCDLGALINDARTQAQKLAGAAGLSAGFIVGIAGLTSNTSASCVVTVKFALGLMFAQGPFAITVTATRAAAPGPLDQVSIGLTVTSSLTAGPDDVTQALKNAGIAGAAFMSVTTQTQFVPQAPSQQVLAWSYTETVPLAKLANALTQLATARQSLSTAGMTLSFSVLGAASSAQPVCSDADLVADARTFAQKLAAAAGVSAGPILTLSDQGSGAAGLSIVPAFRSGDFSSVSFTGTTTLVGGLIGIPTAYVPAPVPACARTVQFELAR